MVDDGDHVGKGLARPGTSGQDVVGPRVGRPNRISLVPMKDQWLSMRIRIRLPTPEHIRRGRVKKPLVHQVSDLSSRLERRVQANARRRPEPPFIESVLGEQPNTRPSKRSR